mgnify:CR=1 FL=1
MSLHVEILATGDELLTGQVVDTNSVWLMDRLWDLGVMVRRKTLVGDDRADLDAALRETSSRADLVLMSGGLGPTEDDRTREALAKALSVPLVEDAAARAHVADALARRPASEGLRLEYAALQLRLETELLGYLREDVESAVHPK